MYTKLVNQGSFHTVPKSDFVLKTQTNISLINLVSKIIMQLIAVKKLLRYVSVENVYHIFLTNHVKQSLYFSSYDFTRVKHYFSHNNVIHISKTTPLMTAVEFSKTLSDTL